MTGLERNADVVTMASYAPLFAHADGWQWTPDLIWVNNLQAFGTPDYYVQKLFSLYKGSKVVPITTSNAVIAGQDSLYASAVLAENSRELIIKLVNVSGQPKNLSLVLDGKTSVMTAGKRIVLKGNDPAAVNSFELPRKLVPEEFPLQVKNKKISLEAEPYSFSVLRVPLKATR